MSTSDIIDADLPIGAHHYRAFIGPPENYDLVAAMQFNLLTHLGLREFHFLLDIGCGSLRAGKLFIPYLLPRRYFGIEPERWLIEEGIENELGRDIIRIKAPIFGYQAHFDCGEFGQKFDFILAQSIFSHASQAQILECLSNVRVSMQPTGVLAATFLKGSSDYEGCEWVYPGCVTYTIERMKRLAAESGLEANPIDWPHPNGQAWLLITQPGHAVVSSSLRTSQESKKTSWKRTSRMLPAIEKPLCIIGMHRSGTSMVARLLNLCGLNLGPEDMLLGASPDNVMGHFEHRGFLEIDDALLRYFGGSWDNPPLLDSGWENDPNLRELFAKAEHLINFFTNSAPWGWKEPRTTLLLPFWEKLLPDLRYIICIRNPLDVAVSLGKRDGVSIPAAAQLWSQYTRAAIKNTEGRPRILSFYEDYFSNPLYEVNRVVRFGGLDKVGDPSRVLGIISGELRHQKKGAAELLDERRIPTEHKVLYFGLRTLASEERAGLAIDDSSQTETPKGIGGVLSLIDQLHDQERILQWETELGIREQQLSAFRARTREELREKSAQIKQLQDHNLRLQAFSAAVRKSLVYRFYKTFLRPFRGRETNRGV